MIHASTPNLNMDDVELAIDAAKNSYGPLRSKYSNKFSSLLSNYFNNRSVVLFSHCTNAILTSLIALKALHPTRNEVIIPALSWVATASTVINAGLKPIFVDVRSDTICLDEVAVDKLINSSTLAVMAVDLLGNMADYFKLKDILKPHKDVYLLQDSAEALGAKLTKCETVSGLSGDISFLSFHATKLINCGQGGAAIIKNDNIAEKISVLSHHGINTSQTGKYYWSSELGMNFAWSDMQAALGYSQFLRLSELIEERVKIFNMYEEQFKGFDNISLMKRLNHCNQVFWLPFFSTPLIKCENDKKSLILAAENAGIQLRPMFYPITEMPPFRNFSPENPSIKFKNSYSISNHSMTLPSSAIFNPKDILITCDFIKKYFI